MTERATNVATQKSTGAKNTTTKKSADTNNTTTANVVTSKPDLDENLNLDTRVTVKNLAGWDVTFKRKHDGDGDILITKEGKQRLSRNEIQAQVNDGNKLFVGVGNGKHATIYIEDDVTRQWVGFEDENKPQEIFTDELVKNLFSISQAEFEASLSTYIVTRAEKYALIEAIKRLCFNDYHKIVFASNYTGYKL